MYGTFIGRRRKRMDLVPGPARRVLDEPLDRERPLGGGQLRCGLGGEHGPAASRVVLAGGQPRISRTPVAAGEPAGEPRHRYLASLSLNPELLGWPVCFI